VVLDLIAIAPTGLGLQHVTGLGQVRDDVVGTAFGDVETGGDVPEAHIGLAGDAQEDPPVVREKAPGRHGHRP